ncbi:MAG: hypothetical protein U1E56_12040 [Bauldia sp.]
MLPTHLDLLRQQVAALEGRPALALPECGGEGGPERLTLGLDGIDRRLGGGLVRAGLHEIRSALTRENGAANGFALAVLARLTAKDRRPVLWVSERWALAEAGVPYGPGFLQFGLDPERLILVETRRPEEALFAFEEGLACQGLAAVLGEIRGNPAVLDLTASRRLALRAQQSGVTGLFLHQAGEAEPSAALTRWRVGPLAAGTMDGFQKGIGRPAWHLELERNRSGAPDRFDVEWDHESRRFTTVAKPAALPLARPALPLNRPYSAPDAWPQLALGRTG